MSKLKQEIEELIAELDDTERSYHPSVFEIVQSLRDIVARNK